MISQALNFATPYLGLSLNGASLFVGSYATLHATALVYQAAKSALHEVQTRVPEDIRKKARDLDNTVKLFALFRDGLSRCGLGAVDGLANWMTGVRDTVRAQRPDGSYIVDYREKAIFKMSSVSGGYQGQIKAIAWECAYAALLGTAALYLVGPSDLGLNQYLPYISQLRVSTDMPILATRAAAFGQQWGSFLYTKLWVSY